MNMKNALKIAAVIALACAAMAIMERAEAAGSQSDDVTWTLPTQRVDGAALTAGELDYTEIEISRDGAVVANDAVPAPGTAYAYTRPLPPNYTLCYRARVADTDGLLSDWSSPVCKTVKGKPQPPSGLTVK